jgi:hypothetical protein
MLLSGYFPNENIRNLALCVNAAEGACLQFNELCKGNSQFKPFPRAGV